MAVTYQEVTFLSRRVMGWLGLPTPLSPLKALKLKCSRKPGNTTTLSQKV